MQASTEAWLARQCQLIAGASQGVLVLSEPTAANVCWPRDAGARAVLTEAAESAIGEQRGLIRARDSASSEEPEERDIVAVPICPNGELAGAVAVDVPRRPEAQQRAVLQLLQLGSAWLPLLMQRPATPASDTLRAVVELLATALEAERFQAAATAVATDLATRLSCERVSLGFLEGREIRVEAVSHSAHFDARTRLAHEIAAAMEEAVDQETALVHPAPDEASTRVVRAHEELRSAQGNGAVCTFPLSTHGRIVGALTVEYPREPAPGAMQLMLCEQVAALLGPILAAKRSEEHWLGRKAWETLRAHASRHLGPDHPGWKLAGGILAVLLGALLIVPATHRISAPARLEGTVQRVVVAPMDGYIAESRARAGDIIKHGDVLGALDDTDLTLERRRWSGRRAQIVKQYRAALSEHDRTQVSILRAQLDQAEAEIALREEQLARSRLVAPFTGVVARGDLSRSLGSPVARGEVLFEIAPLDSYRIVLEVDEREIAYISTGQQGELTLSAIPDTSLPLRVERLDPISTAEEARNFFRVEARLSTPAKSLRPGMEGIGKIEVGRRSLFWIWTHSLIDWLRLWAWAWVP